MAEREEKDEQLREAQEDTGYGADEGEREDALESEEPTTEREAAG